MENKKENIENDILHKEIELIQNCINRMAQNSFILKGWMVAIIVVVIGVLHEKINTVAIGVLTGIIVLIFWYLDSTFLMLERLYRKKYEWVIKERLEGNSLYLYDLNPYNKNMWIEFKGKETCVLSVMFSKTIAPFYVIPIIVLVLTMIYI